MALVNVASGFVRDTSFALAWHNCRFSFQCTGIYTHNSLHIELKIFPWGGNKWMGKWLGFFFECSSLWVFSVGWNALRVPETRRFFSSRVHQSVPAPFPTSCFKLRVQRVLRTDHLSSSFLPLVVWERTPQCLQLFASVPTQNFLYCNSVFFFLRYSGCHLIPTLISTLLVNSNILPGTNPIPSHQLHW